MSVCHWYIYIYIYTRPDLVRMPIAMAMPRWSFHPGTNGPGSIYPSHPKSRGPVAPDNINYYIYILLWIYYDRLPWWNPTNIIEKSWNMLKRFEQHNPKPRGSVARHWLEGCWQCLVQCNAHVFWIHPGIEVLGVSWDHDPTGGRSIHDLPTIQCFFPALCNLQNHGCNQRHFKLQC